MKQAGATLPIHSLKACIVYETTTGRVHHVHRVMTLQGGREPLADKMAEDALHALRALPNPPKGDLGVLHVDHDAIEPNKRYRVNVKAGVLAAHE